MKPRALCITEKRERVAKNSVRKKSNRSVYCLTVAETLNRTAHRTQGCTEEMKVYLIPVLLIS